jgi:chromate reductase, NAD(P)H dehydrogenase (quinone)
MSTPVRILGIAGSLRRASYNRAALRAATQLVPAGVTLDIFELDGIPGFNQDKEQNPPAKWSFSEISIGFDTQLLVH